MTAFNYARSKATADRLISKFGQTVAIRRTSSTGDAWNPTQTTTDYAATAAIVDYTNQERAGSLIEETDRKAIIAVGALAIEPKPGDALVVSSVAYPIIRVDPVNPGGTVVLYQAQVRF
jgi:hypothetical protein